jgi:hypothetical protein
MITITPKMIPTTSSTAADAFADTLTITGTGGPINEAHTVALHETAQGAIFSLNPTALAFPNTNGSATRNFTVNNTGNLAASYTLNRTGSTDFVVTPGTGNAGGGGSVTHAVTFTKRLLAPAQTGSLTLSTTAGLCAPLPAALGLSGN